MAIWELMKSASYNHAPNFALNDALFLEYRSRAGSNVSAGYAASSALISGDFISSPLAMPTPGGMGAVNPSVLGSSSLESGGGSTTNTTNNFYMDSVQSSQNVNTDQIARSVQSLMSRDDAWRKIYAGPWR